VIATIRHKGLKRLYENNDRSKLPPDMVDRIQDILTSLQYSSEIAGLDNPGYRLHALQGTLKGYWAITVRANWRITFRFEDGAAYDIDFLDYH
jgi:proteic killer suppression protein